MKDIHNHLLPYIDDGMKDKEESLYTIKKLKEMGFSDFIFTPHYIIDSQYDVDNIKKTSIYNDLNQENTYLGNEIYINDQIIDLIKENKIKPLNNSRYLLVEFSLFNQLSNDYSILIDLIKYGYTPVLAHPERYHYYQHNMAFFKLLVDNGILLQGNLTSLLNKKERKILLNLLDLNLIHFLATDIHREKDLVLINRSLIILNRLLKKDKINELLNINPGKVINDEPLTNQIVIKTSLLDRFKRRFI